MDHKGGVVLELDSGVDGYQQRHAAEPNAVPARLLRRLSPTSACHPRPGASQSRWLDILDGAVEPDGRVAGARDVTQLCHYIVCWWCARHVEG